MRTYHAIAVNAPEDREKAAVLIYQEGMLTYKRIMQMECHPDGNGSGGRRNAEGRGERGRVILEIVIR